MKIRELGIDFDYSSVEMIESKRKYAVSIITKLFGTKGIQILIGTIALIGEGWDAPFVNSLIIASSVSTYVTSNQVRGRAIRVDKSVPGKVSNIWHLVTMENDGASFVPGRDYRTISERFAGFEGINCDQDTIETGVDRLNVRTAAYTEEEVRAANRKTLEKAADRPGTAAAWERALAGYVPEYYEKISDRTVAARYPARFGFMRRRKVVKLTESLITALKRAGIISRRVTSRVEFSERTGYKVLLSNASTREQILFAAAARQQYDAGTGARYAVSFFDRIYPIPDVLGRKKKLAEIYRQSLGLPFSKLIYIWDDAGKRILLKNKLRNI